MGVGEGRGAVPPCHGKINDKTNTQKCPQEEMKPCFVYIYIYVCLYIYIFLLYIYMSALHSKVVKPLAKGSSRFEKVLPHQKKNVLA